MNTKQRIKESIKTIDKWLDNPNSHSFNTERLISMKSRYLDFLDLANCQCDVKKYVNTPQSKLESLRDL